MAETFEIGALQLTLCTRITESGLGHKRIQQEIAVLCLTHEETEIEAEFDARELYEFLYRQVFPRLSKRVHAPGKS